MAAPRPAGTVGAVPARLLPALVLTAALAALSGPATATAAAAPTPKTETAAAGAVAATFTYTDVGESKWEDLKLTVTRAGVPVYDSAPTVEGCEEPYCMPFGIYADSQSLRVMDLDADGEPEVLIDLYTGGAHCCVIAQILRWTGTGYATASRDFADAGYTLEPGAAPGQPMVFTTGDQRFAYAFGPFAYAPFPVRLLTFTGGVWRDVTRAHPETLRAEAAKLRKEYMKRRKGTLALGTLAAWAADEYRLGHQSKVKAFLRAELRAGRLRGDRIWPRRKAFITTLERRLKAWGYAAG